MRHNEYRKKKKRKRTEKIKIILQYYPGAFSYRQLSLADNKFTDHWFMSSCIIMIGKMIENFKIHGGGKQEKARLEYLLENSENLKILENNLLRGC